MKSITIIGGGNSAHALIPLLADSRLEVNLLTRRPDNWLHEIKLDFKRPDLELVKSFKGRISKISDDPHVVIPDSDIIMLCMPVYAYREALHKIAPHINKNKNVYIGTIFGQGGFNWMTQEIAYEFGLENIRTFAIGLIPIICRTEEYGKKGIVFGAKPVNVAAVEPAADFNYLDEILFEKVVYDKFGHGKFRKADNFLSLTMSVDNQILHTSRMYGLYLEHGGVWDNMDEVPYFYSGFTKESAKILRGLDNDYSIIRKRIKRHFPDKKFTYMMDYIEQDNVTNLKKNKTYLDTFKNSDILVNIKAPVIKKENKFILNMEHRFIKDDIYYGLCIAKSIAQMLNVRTYHIDKTLTWAQEMLGDKIISNRKLDVEDQVKLNKFKFGIPEAYGMKTLDEIFG